MATGITIDGLASGLDTKSVIDQLMAVEKLPLQSLTLKKQSIGGLQSIWKDINSKLLGVQNKAKALKDPKTFNLFKASTSDATLLSVSASSAAVSGSYQISVSQLAKPQVDASTQTWSSLTDTAQLAGTLTLDPEDKAAVTIDFAADDSLTDIKDKINAKTGETAVAASIVQTTPGQYSLVLTGTRTGYASTVAFSDSAKLSFNTSAARNAIVDINGLSVESKSNTISDAIPGATINLLRAPAAGETLNATVTVAKDVDGLVSLVKGLVDQFNGLSDYISQQQTWDAEAKQGGPLLGDSTASGIIRYLQRDLTDPVGGLPGNAINMLSEIGIESGSYGSADFGRMVVNEEELRQSIADNFDQVVALFSGDNGVAARVESFAKNYTDPAKGILPDKDKSLTDQSDSIQDSIDAMNVRLQAMEDRYYAQFTALETALGQLKNQQSWLTAQLSQLPSGS